MPILAKQDLRTLLAEGRITALTVDTNIFDQKRLQLSSPTIQALGRLNGRGFHFMLANTVCKEVIAHLEELASQSLASAKKGLGQALRVFETTEPTRDQLLEKITGGREPKQFAQKRFQQYLKDSRCEILNDTGLVDAATLFEAYFAGHAPFGTSRKKNEFPDALALKALERTATARGIGILVVSKDGDWEKYCRNSERLYHVSDIERALALVADAPPILRKSVLDWVNSDVHGASELPPQMDNMVEGIEFSADATPSVGDCELDVWAGELQGTTWPRVADIDIIEFDPQEDEKEGRLVVSLPLVLYVNIPIDVSFSIWDGVDKESVPMGGRMIDVEEKICTEATIAFDVRDQGTEDAELGLVYVEIDVKDHHVDLGEIELFEPEVYHPDDEEPVGE